MIKLQSIRELFSDTEFNSKVKRLMIPITLQSFILNAVSLGDTVMLGFVSQDSFASVSLAANVSFIMNMFVWPLTGGATLLASQYLGKGDHHTVQRVFCTILRYAVLLSLIFFTLSLAFPYQLMSAFTNDWDMISIGAGYLRICSFSYLFTAISQCFLSMLKVNDRAKACTVITTSVVVLDLILNAIFIYGLLGCPPMGADGAALTTSISKFLELAAVIVYTLCSGAMRPRLRELFRILPKLEREYWRYSLPIFINAAAWCVGSTVYSAVIGHLGSDPTAAYTVINVIKNLVVSLSTGMASASGIVMGRVLGDGQLEKGRVYGARLAKLSILCGFVCAVLTFIIGPLVLAIFKTTQGARDYLRPMLIFCSLNCIGRCVNDTVITGVFNSGGDTAFDGQSIIATMWGIIIPLTLCAAFWWKLSPLWVYFIMSMDELIKLPWVYQHYKKYAWVRNITRDDLYT